MCLRQVVLRRVHKIHLSVEKEFTMKPADNKISSWGKAGRNLTHIIHKSFWWQPNNEAGEGIESGFIFRWSDRLGI